MATRTTIDRKKFLEIKNLIAKCIAHGDYNAEVIAKKAGVGATTVRAVRRAGSFPKYQKLNQARTSARKSETQVLPAGTALVAADSVAPMTPSKPEHTAFVQIPKNDLDNILHSINAQEERLQSVETWKERVIEREQEESRIKNLREQMPREDNLPRKRSIFGRRK